MLGDPIFASGPLRGEVVLPGDKSISHRAVIAAAQVARRSIAIERCNPGTDVEATLKALAALGVASTRTGDEVTIEPAPLRSPATMLDCMNSGSTARMLLGACAGAGIHARFDGDGSLRRRPMEPVAAQLRAFGARIETTGGHLPLELHGTSTPQTRHFILLAQSAQVKTALLFAALFSKVSIVIQGDRGSRDHTERLLRFLGADIEWDGRCISFQGGPLAADRLQIPGDFSAGAFFITAAAITPGSALVVRDVGINSTRTGLLDALMQMGAHIEVRNLREASGEPIADVGVEYTPMHATSIGPDLSLRAIDEIPLLAVAAAFAPGQTHFGGVGSLRSKESDRIAGIARLLSAVGIEASADRGQLTVNGGAPAPNGTSVDTQGDHRIAMAAAVLACAAGPLSIDSDASIAVSFPGFTQALESLRA